MKKKIILALAVVVILLGAGFAYAYFATDLFKTEKEMFFSYISLDDSLKVFEDEKVTQYVEKQQNTAFTNKGEISLEMSGDETLASDESIQMLNNTNITFEGKTDTASKLAEQNITIDLGQGFNIPFKFKCDGESIGIQTDFLDSKFVAVKNENLKALVEKFGIESDEIPDKIDFTQEQFTEEELKTLEDRYIAILNEKLTDELFSKQKVDKQTIITLNMSEAKFIEVSTKILETLRNDEIILNKVTTTIEDFQTQIDELLNDLKTIETSETNRFEMKIYVESRKVQKYEIAIIEDNETLAVVVIENLSNGINVKMYENTILLAEMSIVKENNENDVSYKMIMKINTETEGEVEFTFTAQYKNIAASDNVEEVVDAIVSIENIDMNLNYKNLTTFAPDTQIEGLNENNTLFLNDATEEQLQNLMINLYTNLGLI